MGAMHKNFMGMIPLLLVFSLIFLLLPAVAAGITTTRCFDTGKIVISQADVQKGQVYARPKGGVWFSVPGNWSFTVSSSRFDSDEGLFRSKNLYEIKIVKSDGIYLDSVSCPGYVFSCKYLTINPISCVRKPGSIILRFSAGGVNSPDELEFIAWTGNKMSYVHSKKRYDKPFKDISLITMGGINYLTWETNLNITEIDITHPYCDSDSADYYTLKRVKCMPYCESDDDCKPDERCNNEQSICESVNCSPCEEAVNHKCVDPCKDNNPCTKDGCDPLTGECTHEKKRGCVINDKCFDIGSVEIIGRVTAYCSENEVWESQKSDGESCDYDYECIDKCINKTCGEEKNETLPVVEAPTPLGEQIRVKAEEYTPYALLTLLIAVLVVAVAKTNLLNKLERSVDMELSINKIIRNAGRANKLVSLGNFYDAKIAYSKALLEYEKLSEKKKAKVYPLISFLHRRLKIEREELGRAEDKK